MVRRPARPLEVRYPEIHLVFADSRRFAEDWTWRFLTTALADATDPSPNGGGDKLLHLECRQQSNQSQRIEISDPYTLERQAAVLTKLAAAAAG